MIFNDETLFVHVPKTAGKSLALALVQTLRRPVHCYVPAGTEKMLRESVDLEGVEITRSSGHEGLKAAARAMRELDGRTLDGFRSILVAVRNPYDLMVSNYHFMRENYEHNRGRENFEIAARSDFETYTRDMVFMPVERWLSVDGRGFSNVRVLRFESLAEDFRAALADLGYTPPPLAVVNASKHGHFSEYLTEAAETHIYEKFAYLFDNGYYERFTAF